MTRLRYALVLIAVAIAAVLYGRIIYGAPDHGSVPVEKAGTWYYLQPAPSAMITLPKEPTSISFITNNGEAVLKLAQNGDIFVHGRLAENDIEVVNAMRTFLREGCTRK